MTTPWAMRIDLDHLHAAAALRTAPAIEAALFPDALWLRGPDLTDTLNARLRQIPGLRFHLHADTLIPAGARLPVRPLPAARWHPLAALLPLKLPTSAFPAQAPQKVPFRLIPSAAEAPANVLLLPRAPFADWVQTAPALRLRPLRFALAEDAALVHGSPLPSLPGQRFVENAAIALPAGYALDPPLPNESLAHAFSLAPGDLLLLDPDGACERLPAEAFVPLTRSALRLSQHAAPAPACPP